MATTEEIRADLAEIVNEVAGIDADDVQLDKSFVDDLDVDSLSMVEVVVAAEEKFGVIHPRRRGQEPQDRRRRRRVHRARPGLTPGATTPTVVALEGSRSAHESHPSRGHRMGTTSPLGGDVASTWDGMLRPLRRPRPHREWAEEMPVKIAGRVAVEPTEVLERVKARRLDRSSQFAMVAAMEAWRDAGLEDAEVDRERLGVAMASGIGGVNTLLDNYDVLKEKGPAGSPRSRCRC